MNEHAEPVYKRDPNNKGLNYKCPSCGAGIFRRCRCLIVYEDELPGQSTDTTAPLPTDPYANELVPEVKQLREENARLRGTRANVDAAEMILKIDALEKANVPVVKKLREEIAELRELLESYVRVSEWWEQNRDSPKSALDHFTRSARYVSDVLAKYPKKQEREEK